MFIRNAKRQAPFNRGRWLLERERCRIADPRPPSPRVEASPMRLAIDTVLHRLRAQVSVQASRAERVSPVWDDMLGPEVQPHCRRGPFENGLVIVYVENNLWLHQIRRFHARRIEQALRERLGPSFRRLVLRLDPGDEG